ncbi:MAG: hypothetical protein UY15_C0021G0022 [Parcubacteria group bacterium GW2011_GWA2_47_9]|nr:MAG: hypothetical protein UY15_C0021G0022 [Parcubacteria group bacterium GW2011_GWA2_47_9]
MKQEKIVIIILAAVVVAAAAAYGAWRFFGSKAQWAPQGQEEKTQAPSPQEGTQGEATSTYGTLPEIESVANPLENLPDLNPVERANPFNDIYTNPFE